MMTVESLIAELQEWPLTARVIVTLVRGDKVPRRFEVSEVLYDKPGQEIEGDLVGEIIITEDQEF